MLALAQELVAGESYSRNFDFVNHHRTYALLQFGDVAIDMARRDMSAHTRCEAPVAFWVRSDPNAEQVWIL